MVNLFFKGIIIGLAKIIPGVSGAMIAVSFSVYDKLIEAITHFFDNKKDNLRFLLVLGSGIVLSIVLGSNIVRYFINNFYISTMLLFIGLIVGGTYNFSRNIEFNKKNILIVLSVLLIMYIVSLLGINNNYVINDTGTDYLMFFIGGFIEIFSSLIPGLSGTSLFMLFGIYDCVLMLIGNSFDIEFVLNNIMLYISYGLGMMISFVGCSLIISYLLKKYRKLFDTLVLGLSIFSIILLLKMAFSSGFILIELFVGVILFFLGIMISYLLDK